MAVGKVTVYYTVLEGGRPSTWSNSFENSAFRFTAENGTASFEFKTPFTRHDAAEQRTTDYLKSWDAVCRLQSGRVRRDFVMKGSDGPGSGSRAYILGSLNFVGPEGEAIRRRDLPWELCEFEEDPLVRGLITRFEDYLSGKERLAVVGYFTLSALESAFRNRAALAEALAIGNRILTTLGRLVSSVGSWTSARKIGADHDLREFTPGETFWMESALRALIDRAGRVRGTPGTKLLRLSMSDLTPVE